MIKHRLEGLTKASLDRNPQTQRTNPRPPPPRSRPLRCIPPEARTSPPVSAWPGIVLARLAEGREALARPD